MRITAGVVVALWTSTMLLSCNLLLDEKDEKRIASLVLAQFEKDSGRPATEEEAKTLVNAAINEAQVAQEKKLQEAIAGIGSAASAVPGVSPFAWVAVLLAGLIPVAGAVRRKPNPGIDLRALKSRKFLVPIATGLLVGLNDAWSLGLGEGTINALVLTALGFVGVEGLGDAMERWRRPREDSPPPLPPASPPGATPSTPAAPGPPPAGGGQ